MFTLDWQFRDHYNLTLNDERYLKATDYEIELWYHTQNAKNVLDLYNQGYDIGDIDLSSDVLRNKYPGNLLENKSIGFRKSDIGKKKELILSAITGRTSKKKEEEISATMVILQVHYFLNELKQLKRFDEWINLTIPYKDFINGTIAVKNKYLVDLMTFYDEIKAKETNEGQFSGDGKVLDSSPLPAERPGGCPDFSDTSKWEPVND